MTRWGRRVIGLAAAACFVLAAASCSGDGASTTTTAVVSTTAAPALSEEQALELQARAIARARPFRRLCMAGESAPPGLRAALAPQYEEIRYVGMTPSGAPDVGWDACRLVSAAPVRRYLPDVVGVDVWVLRGHLNGIGETYLFRWDGTAWVDATPEETGVTVTTAVS
ncbi:MAG: hypothetical protein MUE66_05700 [Acidimicrobiia bacterium]|nr:hypothetical protein [Acidimicrobiia bacterium]